MSPATAIGVHVAPLEHESDMSAVRQLIADGVLRPDEVVAVTGKTEGTRPGETSRAAALAALREVLATHGTRTPEQIADIPIVLTAGGVGLLAPHVLLYTRSPWDGPVTGEPRLAVGTALTGPIPPEHVGHVPMVQTIADGVRAAADDAGIVAAEAQYVLTKSHALLPQDITEAAARGVQITPFDPVIAAQKVNGAASLGVAVAVDGLPLPADEDIATNLDLWSGRASASGGREDRRTHIVLLGNSSAAGGHLRVAHSVMADLLDIDALFRALRDAGLPTDGRVLTEDARRRIAAVYVKIGTPPDARLRGRRQVHEGENPEYLNQLKAAVAGMFSAALQDTILYISSAATHQGPAGGGTVAVVVDCRPGR